MTPWRDITTPEKIEAIKGVYQFDMSAADIARALESKHGLVTRNSIVGIYGRHREKLEGHPLRVASQDIGKNRRRGWGKAKPKASVARPGAVKRPPKIASEKPTLPPAPKPAPPRHAPAPRNLTLVQLTSRTCKWPVNDGHPFLFCGCEKPIEHSYCAYHAHLSVGEGTESERTAHRVGGLA